MIFEDAFWMGRRQWRGRWEMQILHIWQKSSPTYMLARPSHTKGGLAQGGVEYSKYTKCNKIRTNHIQNIYNTYKTTD